MSKKNIVIIGGGYAGLSTIAKLQGYLPTSYKIVLIEQQDFFYVKLGGARAAASEDIADQILVPYDKLFKSPEAGVVVKSSVTKINPHSVVLSEPHKSFGSEIDFDYLVHFPFMKPLLPQVIAVGSSWNDPIALQTFTKKDAVEVFSKRRQQIAAAKNIVIVGAGPVGVGMLVLRPPSNLVELSGEIKMAHPEKHVTIVHAGRLPISDAFPDSFREKTVNSIKGHGVELLLNEKVDTTSLGASGQLKLKSGKTLPADLIVFSVG
jgi:apoptosis-inducing factor 2